MPPCNAYSRVKKMSEVLIKKTVDLANKILGSHATQLHCMTTNSLKGYAIPYVRTDRDGAD